MTDKQNRSPVQQTIGEMKPSHSDHHPVTISHFISGSKECFQVQDNRKTLPFSPLTPQSQYEPQLGGKRTTKFTVLVNSLPKSGTHLLKKLVDLLGYRGTEVHISKNLVQGNEHFLEPNSLLPAGVDWPELVSAEVVREFLLSVPRGCYASAHMPYSKTFCSVLRELAIKTLLILRDPRDVVVSMANYVVQDPGHFLYSYYKDLSEEDRITISITGLKPSGDGQPGLFSIAKRWEKVMPWMDQAYNSTTFFEKLVGPNGGGTRHDQQNEIRKIAKHIGLDATTKDLFYVAGRLFGGTTTFRRGKIGSWRKKFTKYHKQIFKKIAGDLLIEWGYEKDYYW